MVAGQRPQRPVARRGVPHGRLLHREPVVPPRRVHPAAHLRRSADTPGRGLTRATTLRRPVARPANTSGTKDNVLGVLVDAVDYTGAVERIVTAGRERRGFSVTALAVHGV